MGRIRVARLVDAPRDVVWDLVADVEAIHQYADNVADAAIVDGDGLGMHRRCWNHAGGSWDEECVVWEVGRRYAFIVDTTTSGERIHRLFQTFVGTFAVEEEEAGGTVLSATFDMDPRFGPIGRLLFRAMNPMARRGITALVDSWAAEAERRHAAAPPTISDPIGS